MEPTNESLGQAILQAIRIARAAGNPDLYYVFDVMEDELHLAETQTYGTIAACRACFDVALKEYGRLPFAFRER